MHFWARSCAELLLLLLLLLLLVLVLLLLCQRSLLHQLRNCCRRLEAHAPPPCSSSFLKMHFHDLLRSSFQQISLWSKKISTANAVCVCRNCAGFRMGAECSQQRGTESSNPLGVSFVSSYTLKLQFQPALYDAHCDPYF